MNKKIVTLAIAISLIVMLAFTRIAFAQETCVPSNPSISIFPSNQSGNGTLFYSINLKNNDNSYCNTTDFRISCDTGNPDLKCFIISSGYPEIPTITESFMPPGYAWPKTIKVNSSSTLSQGSYPFTITIDDGAFNRTVTKSASVTGYYTLKPSLIITTEYKTVKFGETFYISASSSSPYKWELWNYDKNYLDSKGGVAGCTPSGNCNYSFQFIPSKNIKTITIVDIVRKDEDNYIVEKKQTYVTIETTNSTCRNINDQCNSNDECCSKTCVNNKTIGLCKETYVGPSCVDSDNRDYYKKGTVFGLTNINYTAYSYYANWDDVCAKDTSSSTGENDKALFEYFCYGGYYNSETYFCSNGCQDGACLSSNIPITEEYKTVNLGEIFTVSGDSSYPYTWSLKNYDKNYLELQPIATITCKAEYGSSCPYNFEFKAINSGKTTIELDEINTTDNSVAQIKYIYVTINPSETKIAYLNQPFDLNKGGSAEIVDYRNMIVTLNDLEPLTTTCSATTITTGGAGCAGGDWIATVSMSMPGNLVGISMKINLGESKDTPFGVKISFDRMTDSNTGVFTVYQETNDFNFNIKTDNYYYSSGENVIITAILSESPSIDLKDAVIMTTVTDPNGVQYQVRMDTIGTGISTCAQSVTTKTYTCVITNEYHFTGTFNIPSDAPEGNYRVMSTAVASGIRKNAETNFEVGKTTSSYVDVSISPKEQHAVIGNEVTYQVTVTDKHPISLCPVRSNQTGEILPANVIGCMRPTYTYTISVNGLPYNTKYQNVIGLPAGGAMTFTLYVFPSSTGTSEGVATATTTTGTINPASSEQRIVSVVTGEAVATPVTTQETVKEVMFKFTVQATQQDDPTVSNSDGAILYVRFIETPQPPPFPETEKIDIELRNSWNLISAPGYGYFSSGTCSAASKPVAFIYLTDQKRYVSFDEALSIMGTDKLKEYLSTHSFWVYSYESCKMTFDIEKYSTYSGLQLDQGWNLLGITKDMVGETMSNIKGTCTFEKLYSWDADSQKWVTKTENDLIDRMGYGDIVKASSACNLNTNIIQPPSVQGG